MQVVHATQTAESENPHGVSARKLHDTEHMQVVHITLEPREALRRHETPLDVFFYVLEGVGTVEIGDQQQSVRRDDLVHSPAGIPHRLMNDGEAAFRFLVVKTPAP